MSYGLDNNVKNMVSDHVLLFLTVLQLDFKKKENVVPKKFYRHSRLWFWYCPTFHKISLDK